VSITEPEVEQVAVDEQCIAERRHLGQKAEEGVGHLQWGSAQVRISDGNDGGP